MRLSTNRIVPVIVAAVLLLGGAYYFWGRSAPRSDKLPGAASTAQPQPGVIAFAPGAPQLSAFKAEAVVVSNIPVSDALAGRVAYDDDRTVRVFPPVAGRLVDIKVQAGDRVQAGQVLGIIDAADFGTALADLQKAQADENRKKLAYERARDLGPGEGIAVKDVEAAKAELDSARAESARAQQRVRNLNPRGLPVVGQQISLTSPVTGVVSERNVSRALEVAPGGAAPLFVVTDMKHLWLLIDLPERLLATVKPGARVAIEADAYAGEQFEAQIVQVGQVLDPNTRRVVARARVDNTMGKLLPEMFVRALVLQDGKPGVRIPNSSIVNRGVYSYVFVELAPGKYERRQVDLVVRGAEYSYAPAGVKPGEKIVTSGALLLDAESASAQKS